MRPATRGYEELYKSTNVYGWDRGDGVPLWADQIPAYYEKMDRGGCMGGARGRTACAAPSREVLPVLKPGDGNARWRPSWRQAMDEALPSMSQNGDKLREWLPWDNTYTGYCIEKCHGRTKLWEGELVVKGISRSVRIVADHQHPISEEGSYTLMGSKISNMMFWVVGRRREGEFEKVSVFQVPDAGELRRLGVVKEKVEVDLW